jgi:DNA-binding Lrp family transcriptional regulator
MQVTDRDREIIRRVLRHRFLRSWQIAALVGGSKQAVLRRLQLLYHHGYLERPRAQIEYYQQGGSRALVYGLADRGAELLRTTVSDSPQAPDWRAKNRGVQRLFLEHALLVSDVLVGLELACRRNGGVKLLHADQLSLPAEMHKQREPFRWNLTLEGRKKLGVIPDRVFALEFSNLPSDRNRAYFFLEADRATMPVIRANLGLSSFYRKFLAYEATWTQKVHSTQFGFHRFRVLCVTTSQERVTHLIEACRQLPRGHGLFLFTNIDTFTGASDPFSLQWQSSKDGQTARLIDG